MLYSEFTGVQKVAVSLEFSWEIVSMIGGGCFVEKMEVFLKDNNKEKL